MDDNNSIEQWRKDNPRSHFPKKWPVSKGVPEDNEANRKRRDQYVSWVRDGEAAARDGFDKMGRGLFYLRECRLYMMTHKTWEAFCEETLAMSKSNANRMIRTIQIKQSLPGPKCEDGVSLGPCGPNIAHLNIRQLEALGGVAKADRMAVIEAAAATGSISETSIKAAARFHKRTQPVKIKAPKGKRGKAPTQPKPAKASAPAGVREAVAVGDDARRLLRSLYQSIGRLKALLIDKPAGASLPTGQPFDKAERILKDIEWRLPFGPCGQCDGAGCARCDKRGWLQRSQCDRGAT